MPCNCGSDKPTRARTKLHNAKVIPRAQSKAPGARKMAEGIKSGAGRPGLGCPGRSPAGDGA
eukprot:3147140-Lingulodinium_polyedra.AAC.1